MRVKPSELDPRDVAIGVAILRRQSASEDGALFADVLEHLGCGPEAAEDVAGRIVALYERGMVTVRETVRVSPGSVDSEYGFRVSPDYEGFFSGIASSSDIY